MSSNPLNSRSARVIDALASAVPWITLVFGAALIAFSIWGFWFCRAVAHEDFVPVSSRSIVVVLGWAVVFLPVALLGTGVSVAALRHLRTSGYLGGSQARIQIMPPQLPARPNGPAHPLRTEPMDDATIRHLNHIADRTARIFSISAGVLLLAGGLAGFVMGWIYTYHPPGGRADWQNQIVGFRLMVRFLVGCGLAVLAGLIILRATFRKPDTEWLLPLKVFTGIVGRRAMEEAARTRKPGPRQ